MFIITTAHVVTSLYGMDKQLRKLPCHLISGMDDWINHSQEKGSVKIDLLNLKGCPCGARGSVGI